MIRALTEQDVPQAGGVAEAGLDFDDFARSRQAHLCRSAYLLCGDWHLAEDLTQTALAKLYAVWRRVRKLDAPDAYARRVLFRTFIDETRRRRWWERIGAHHEEVVAPAQDPALRLTLLDALRQVPARSRAVLVHWSASSPASTPPSAPPAWNPSTPSAPPPDPVPRFIPFAALHPTVRPSCVTGM